MDSKTPSRQTSSNLQQDNAAIATSTYFASFMVTVGPLAIYSKITLRLLLYEIVGLLGIFLTSNLQQDNAAIATQEMNATKNYLYFQRPIGFTQNITNRVMEDERNFRSHDGELQ